MNSNGNTFEIPEELKRIGLIKFEILASGLKVSDEAWEYMAGAKTPIRTRSGASGGLDLILPYEVHVKLSGYRAICVRFAATAIYPRCQSCD